ncbi:MAG: glycosyltransferase [archaeon]
MIEEKELIQELSLGPVSLAHLELLSDGIGLRQHAIHGVPLLESGYTVDDNARALVALLDFGELFKKERLRAECIKYLSFLGHMQLPNGWFRNTLLFDRHFGDEEGSPDCFGRAVWACGRAMNSWLDENQRINAKKMLEKTMPQACNLADPRPIAFALLGLCEAAKAEPENRAFLEAVEILAGRMAGIFEKQSSGEWPWFEDILTYDNARLPHAMFAAFQVTGENRFLGIAEKSFSFLAEKTAGGEMFEPVGQDGWYPKGGQKALFDQQPIEAAAMVQAATAGFFAASDDDYKRVAGICFNWFFGGNSLGAAVYDKKTGACFDGLTPKEVNLNQGAESTVEFLLARFCMERLKRQKI